MSFQQLTIDWPDQPLTDPAHAANVVDLMVDIGDRYRGTFTVLLCHSDGRYRSTVIVELPPPGQDSPAKLCETALGPIVEAVRTAPGTAVVLALGRSGPEGSTDADDQWAAAATETCAAAGIRLLGFYIATRDGVHQPRRCAEPGLPPVGALT
ncbi:hypothetical protein [Kribbella sp.]|uniref:hypothetical protein n=1 Tax=Kribbella sp. TaxID=1871183 RepID=UPI002D2F1738|nr:hypothetical protein [Kribbella sp.]HZX03207.1 hypothetical protein [Kribbella sp.]